MYAHVRNLRPVLLAFIAVMSRPCLARAQAVDCAEDIVYPPDAVVHGKTAGEWSARFWQWLAAIPKSSNPALDRTGERCGIEQTDPVFFLAAHNLGLTAPVVFKDCYVPCGRDILMPLWSTVAWAPGDCDLARLDDCRGLVKDVVDGVEARRLIVDGRSIGCLEDYRAVSPEFQFTLPPDNLFDLPPPLERTGVADGYYVFLRAFTPGKHIIIENVNWRGDEIPAATYELTVGPCDTTTFRRGDSDANGSLNLTDAVAILGRLFQGQDPLPCDDAADGNDDGGLNITDAVYILEHLFRSGPPPPAPGPADCGMDPTEDSLDCSEGC